tara:strand:- start:586 stop:1281 length:696 start_codon:yes stop_codon:yes gene_type:complete
MKAKITIPETLNEIKLFQYQEFLVKSEGLTDYDLAQCMVECFLSLPKVVVLKMSLKEVTAISVHLNELFQEKQQLQLSFKLESEDVSQEFGFINDIENMSIGEYTDLDTYVTDWNNMHKTMAVLYRPLITRYKDKYTIAEYEGTSEFSEVMKFMPLDVALGSLVFFYRLGNELLAATRQYLVQEVAEMALQEKNNLQKDGGGTIASTHSLREMLLNLTQLPNYQLHKRLPI